MSYGREFLDDYAYELDHGLPTPLDIRVGTKKGNRDMCDDCDPWDANSAASYDNDTPDDHKLSGARVKGGICPGCRSPLVLRHGKYGEFYGCMQFPKCKFTCSVEEFRAGLEAVQQTFWAVVCVESDYPKTSIRTRLFARRQTALEAMRKEADGYARMQGYSESDLSEKEEPDGSVGIATEDGKFTWKLSNPSVNDDGEPEE